MENSFKFCTLLPLTEDQKHVSQHTFHVDDGTSIVCEPSGRQKTTFGFQKVFTKERGLDQNETYHTTMEPLVHGVTKGESNMVILGGAPTVDVSKYLTSTEHHKSLLVRSASYLTHADPFEKGGSITLTWCKVDCTRSSEPIIDVLKNASTGAKGQTSGVGLRDLGKGRGNVVTGLTEVAFTAAADVEAIVNQVISTQADLAPDLTSHTLIQFVYYPSKAPTGSHNKSLSLLEPVGTGRMTFMILSAFSPAPLGGNISTRVRNFHWVDALPDILEVLGTGMVQPKFSVSRTLMLLRDVLMGRQKTSLMLHLLPVEGMMGHILMWLELFQHLGTNQRLSSTKEPVLVSTNKQKAASAVKTRPPPLPSTATKKTPGSTTSHSTSNKRTEDLVRVARNTNTSPVATTQSLHTQSHSHSTKAHSPSPLYDSVTNALNTPSSGAVFLTPKSSISLMVQADSTVASKVVQNPTDHSASPTIDMNKNDAIHSMRASPTNPNPTTMSDGPSLKEIWAAEGRLSEPTENEKLLETRIQSLTTALTSCQGERDTLISQLTATNEKFDACREAFDRLLDELQQEGTTLQAKDREKFRKCLRDIKDYEIYKSVMESTMLRMQTELNSLNEESINKSKEIERLQITLTKQRSVDGKHSKLAADAQKKMASLERALEESHQGILQLEKEKDIALSTLIKTKTEMSKKNKDLIAESKHKDHEILSLQKKNAELADRLRSVLDEKKSLQYAYNKEIKELRNGNSQAVEMIMDVHQVRILAMP